MSLFLAPTSPEVSGLEIRNMRKVRELAVECMVLLKNDGTLPLPAPGRLALYGNGARATVKGGTGSGDVYVRETISIEDGLAREGFTITTGDWIDRQQEAARKEKEEYERSVVQQAIDAGQTAESAQMMLMLSPLTPKALEEITQEDVDKSGTELAVYVLSRNSGEGKDRKPEKGDYELSDMEEKNLRFLAERYSKLIVLLNIGGVIDTKILRSIEGINTIVLSGQMGNMTGLTVADLLLGKGYPSGKLTDTWAENYMDYPSSETFSGNDGDISDEYYTEGIFVGYRYFDTFNITPAYEFGFGLNYTDFSVETEEVLLNGTEIRVKVKVTNTGRQYPGKEVVQVYVTAPSGKLIKPYQELRGFAKTKLLDPGEAQTVIIRIRTESFASYCEESAAYVLEAGEYVLRVGTSSRRTHVEAVISLPETVITEKLTTLFKDPAGKTEETVPEGPVYTAVSEEAEKAEARRLELDPENFRTWTVQDYQEPQELPKQDSDHIYTFDEVADGKLSLEAFISQLTDEELAFLMVGNSVDNKDFGSVIGSAAKHLPGAAGETTDKLAEKRNLKRMELCDGPAGLRLTPEFIEKDDGSFEGLGGMSGAGDSRTAGIHHYQYTTAIPIAMTLAASWNMDLLETCGDIVGSEMEAFGATLWLAPGMNIHRNPLCGRNFEYFSEDPLLAGKCAASETRGVQRHPGYGTTIKHFLANSQEDNRMFTNSHVGERAIREIYARNFRIVVEEAQPMALMTSYNLVNGVHAANHADSLTHMLREEWKFQGMVMTDWLTTSTLSSMLSVTTEKKYPKSDAALCVTAQNDLIEPGEMADVQRILEGLGTGVLSRAQLERNAGNILRLMLRTHLYSSRPYNESVPGRCITFSTETDSE